MTGGGPTGPGPEPVPPLPPALSAEEAADLARRHGLAQIGVRPTFGRYLRETWRRRGFILTLAQGDFISRHQNNALGLLWSVLNPLLLGVAYLLIFGLMLETTGGLDNFVPFLLAGLFVFIYISGGLNYAARSVVDSTALVRGLQFPRIVLPLSVSLAEFIATIPAFALLPVVALVTGETPNAAWLLLPVALGIVGLLTAGLGLIAARALHEVRDARNLIPLLTRMLRYVSGVFFPIGIYAPGLVEKHGAPVWVALALEYQPLAVSLTLVRETLLEESPLDLTTWIVATGWAIGFVVVGVAWFWRAEAEYGRN